MDKSLERFVNATGALAEVLALFYNSLIKAGMDKDAATTMTVEAFAQLIDAAKDNS